RFRLNGFADFDSALRGFQASYGRLVKSLNANFCAALVCVCGRSIGRSFGIIAPEPIASVTPSRKSTAWARVALLRRSGLSLQRRGVATARPFCSGLVFVFFVHKLRLFVRRGVRPNKSSVSSKFFRPATWP